MSSTITAFPVRSAPDDTLARRDRDAISAGHRFTPALEADGVNMIFIPGGGLGSARRV